MEEQVWCGWRNLYSLYLDSLGLNYYWELRHIFFPTVSRSLLPASRNGAL